MKFATWILFTLCLIILPSVGYFVKWYKPQILPSKLTAFECGFEPMGKSRIPFSMRFFVLVVLFLIFDVEVALLLPILTKIINFSGSIEMYLTFMFFLITLLLGLFYEWKEGSLDWMAQS